MGSQWDSQEEHPEFLQFPKRNHGEMLAQSLHNNFNHFPKDKVDTDVFS